MSRKRKPETGNFREFVLAELRCAHVKARMYVAEIETIGIGVRGGFIEPADAICLMAEAGTLEFVSEVKAPGWWSTSTTIFRETMPPVFLPPVYWTAGAWEYCRI